MNWPMLLTSVLPGAILILLGYLVRFRKMYFLISGYNTMSVEKKKKVDVEQLARLMGNCLFVMGVLISLGMVLTSVGQSALGLAAFLMVLPVVTYLLVSGQKYDGNTRTASGRMKPGVKILLGVLIGGLVLAAGLGIYSLIDGSRSLSVDVNDSTVTIKGLYGLTIDRTKITRVSLLETLPKIRTRTNGMALGSFLKGHFTMDTYGAVRLYIEAKRTPFILIEWSEKPIIFNLNSAEETRALYKKLTD